MIVHNRDNHVVHMITPAHQLMLMCIWYAHIIWIYVPRQHSLERMYHWRWTMQL